MATNEGGAMNFDDVVAGLEASLLTTMTLEAMKQVNSMAVRVNGVLYVPAVAAYCDVLAPIYAVAARGSMPEGFLQAVHRTEAYLRRYSDQDQLYVFHYIVMDGLDSMIRMLMPEVEGTEQS